MAQRSYFGVYRVTQSESGDFNVLTHGTTLHGAQRIRDEDGTPRLRHHTRHLLLSRQPDGARGQASRRAVSTRARRARAASASSGSAPARSPATRRRRAWRYLRDRSRRHRHRRQVELLHLSRQLPAQADIVIGRRAPDDGQGARQELRPDHRRCLLLRRGAGAPDDGGGAATLRSQAQGQRHPRAAHLQPLSRPRLRAGRDAAAGAASSRGSSSPTTRPTAPTRRTPRPIAVFAKESRARRLPGAARAWRTSTPAALSPWTDDASDILGPFLSQWRLHLTERTR